MSDILTDLPQAETADPDGVQMALRAAQTLWSRGDTTESLRWLRRAAESASDEGADMRSLQLAKAAAELRSKLFGGVAGSGSRALATLESSAPVQAAAAPVEPSRALTSAPASSAGAAWGEENPAPASGPVVTATQYPSQYPSNRPRQLMGLSSSTLETAVQRESGSYSGVPSWSADSERRASSAPPPLPRAAIDDYEELEAEPDEDAAEAAAPAWAVAPVLPQRRSAASVRSTRHEAPLDPDRLGATALGATALASSGGASTAGAAPPTSPYQSAPSASPPPLPHPARFDEETPEIGPAERPGLLLPPLDDNEDEGRLGFNHAASEATAASAAFAGQVSSWDAEPRAGGWDPTAPFAWGADPGVATWGTGAGADVSAALSEAAPPKLTARVHHQAVRVSVAPDVHSPGQFLVRPLREGEKALAGERVALLVALEPGLPLV
jgi:hypothetical protein